MRLNRKAFLLAMGAALAAGGAGSASAATEIQFWHAFTGPLGEILAEQVEGFNGSQADYQVVAAYKGNYSETLNAGIAAFRAGQQLGSAPGRESGGQEVLNSVVAGYLKK